MTDSPAFTRRTLLTLGAATLLAGCTTEPAAPAAAPSWVGGTPAPSAPPASSAPPAPSDCPTYPDVLAKPGDPQQYLPCNGSDIALTIDDGPHPVWTPKVLALLERLDIQATFCVVGENVAAHPDLVARMVDGGHQIANHTFTHPMDLATLAPAKIRSQIGRGTDAILAAGGARPRLFRAPGGNWSAAIMTACAADELRPIDWSIDTKDWSRPGVDAIVETIARTRPGAIILDHDGGGNRQQTVDALGIALPRLLDEGYRFIHP